MDDFTQKLFLAFIAFLFGLLADVIKRLFQREKRRVSYSVARTPIVAVTSAVPEHVNRRLGLTQAQGITHYRLSAQNTGSTIVRDATLLLTLKGDNIQVIEPIIST